MKYKCFNCGKPTSNVPKVGNICNYSICDDCSDRIGREIDYQYETEIVRDKELVCPHCQTSYEDYDAYDFDEGIEKEVECMFCGKKFDLEVECVRLYSTKRSICEMPDDYGKEDA